MRKDSGHVVCCLDQSASFRIFDSAFYFPHSAFRNSAFYPHPSFWHDTSAWQTVRRSDRIYHS